MSSADAEPFSIVETKPHAPFNPGMMMDPTQQQQQQQPFDTNKMFQQERESLELVHHKSMIASAEKTLLGQV
jgi:hypothetical protein